MENKQTAVEWLMMQLPVFIRVDLYEKELYQKAKEKEKEHIRESYYRGVRDEWEGAGRDFEDYYNEKYANDTTTGLPEENSKRRGWHY